MRRHSAARVVAWLLASVLAFALAGCATKRLQGVNLLQSSERSFADADTQKSLRALRALGANTVAIVYFLAQAAPDATDVTDSSAVTPAQLRAAIDAARAQGLQVWLKPQILLPASWAGAVEPGDDAGWSRWFASYGERLQDLARLAETKGVAGLVIGTELRQAGARPEWAGLIAALRRVYRGELSYAAHGVDGLAAFGHWHRLDSAAVTLYPSLGADPRPRAMQALLESEVMRLRQVAATIGRPLWIAELGLASRLGAQQAPWDWRVADPPLPPDPALQARVIGAWLAALDRDWNRGVLLWAWSNDPGAGGPADTSHLLQGKPAQEVMRCHWQRLCGS